MEPTTPEFKPLSVKQFKMLHSTWKLAYAQPMETGLAIFFEFFKKYPNFFAFFKNFYNIPFDELKVSCLKDVTSAIIKLPKFQ